jgi:hypothetical protein
VKNPAILFVGAVLMFQAAVGFAVAADDGQALPSLEEHLGELDPLPKVHYSWPLPFDNLSDELFHQYVRLTHAASLSGEWFKPAQVDRSVAACAKVNAADPKIRASLAVNYSPWHRRFGEDLPPTDVGPPHREELDHLRNRMEMFRDLLQEANRKYDTSVEVTAILFDSERFRAKDDDTVWNEAITSKHDAAYDVVRDVFPKARIEWYSRGAVQPGSSPTGWSPARYLTLEEKGESFGCSLYRVPEIGYTRETYRRTARNARDHGYDEVTPWIALASGYRRQPDSFQEWSYNWDYDLIYSWELGREVNRAWFGVDERADRFAPWHMARVVVFYPEPFGRSPHWGQHFVSYVRGANGIKELP